MIDPDLELDNTERSELASLQSMPGFQVIQKIMRIVVEQARVDLDNADQSKPDEVMAKHALSKATGVAVTRILQRISNEISQHNDAPRPSDIPRDETELLDIDDIKRITQDLPNFLGDVVLEEES